MHSTEKWITTSAWVCACLRVYIAHKIAVLFLTVNVSGIDVCTFGEHGVVLTISRTVVFLPNVVFIKKMCQKNVLGPTFGNRLLLVIFFTTSFCGLHFVARSTAGVLWFMAGIDYSYVVCLVFPPALTSAILLCSDLFLSTIIRIYWSQSVLQFDYH